MKIRFGFTCRGQADLTLDDFPTLVDDLERLGFDSIWLPEIMLNGPFDPLVGLTHAAARTEHLKIGAYVESGPDAPPTVGNCLPLKNIPLGVAVHNVELQPGRGGASALPLWPLAGAATLVRESIRRGPYGLRTPPDRSRNEPAAGSTCR